jgi:hypothetical protein
MAKKLNLTPMIFISLMLIGTISASGCDSGVSGQIEKCVQAAMKSNEPFKDAKDKAETEVIARTYCLRAAAGKD